MDNILVSFIVPVYNGEKYLAECIESILSQTVANFELLIINDGSIDKTQEICEDYELRDRRIRIINKVNEGVSIARNCGIIQSKGSLLCFIDADDLIAEDYLEKLLIVSDKGSFLVGCGFKVFRNDDVLSEVRFNSEKTTSSIYLKSEKRNLASWGWLIPKYLLVDNNIQFDRKLSVSEDTLFMLQLLSKVDVFQTISDNGYLHRDNDSSVCKSPISFNKIVSWLSVDLALIKMDSHRLGKSNINKISGSIEYCAISSLISYTPKLCEREKIKSILKEIVYYRKRSNYRKNFFIGLYLLNINLNICVFFYKMERFFVSSILYFKQHCIKSY